MPAGKERGKIECRHCGCGQSTVVTTAIHKVRYGGRQHTIIKRYRRCRYCKLQFTTVETYEDEENPGFPEIPPELRPSDPAKDSVGGHLALLDNDAAGGTPPTPPLPTPDAVPPRKVKRPKNPYL